MSEKREHPFNILSIDGSGSRCLVQSALVERLLRAKPSFVRDVDLFVSTGMGSVLVLFLARSEEFVDVLQKIPTDQEQLPAFLYDHFADMTLGELSKPVAIVAFDLDNDADEPRWKPKIFHNCAGRDADLTVRLVDVIMYASSFPSHGGYIDGGLVANNPALVGVSQALDPRAYNKKLEDLSLFSLGAGKLPLSFEGEKSDWTIPELLSIVIDGGIEIVNFQCKQLLKHRYWKINPRLPEGSDWLEVANEEDLAEAVQWLRRFWL